MTLILSSRDRGTLAIDSSILPRRAENVKRKTGGIQHPETRGLEVPETRGQGVPETRGQEVPAGVNTRQTGCFLHQFAVVLDDGRHLEAGVTAGGSKSEIVLNP